MIKEFDTTINEAKTALITNIKEGLENLLRFQPQSVSSISLHGTLCSFDAYAGEVIDEKNPQASYSLTKTSEGLVLLGREGMCTIQDIPFTEYTLASLRLIAVNIEYELLRNNT